MRPRPRLERRLEVDDRVTGVAEERGSGPLRKKPRVGRASVTRADGRRPAFDGRPPPVGAQGQVAGALGVARPIRRRQGHRLGASPCTRAVRADALDPNPAVAPRPEATPGPIVGANAPTTPLAASPPAAGLIGARRRVLLPRAPLATSGRPRPGGVPGGRALLLIAEVALQVASAPNAQAQGADGPLASGRRGAGRAATSKGAGAEVTSPVVMERQAIPPGVGAPSDGGPPPALVIDVRELGTAAAGLRDHAPS